MANIYGATKNHAKAVTWYRKASEQGYKKAQLSLAAHYASGLGVPQSFKSCYTWASLSAITDNNNDAVTIRDGCADELTPEALQSAQDEAANLFELFQ